MDGKHTNKYFFMAVFVAAAGAALCFASVSGAADAGALSSSSKNTNLMIDSSVNVRRTTSTTPGWDFGRKEEIDVVSLKNPIKTTGTATATAVISPSQVKTVNDFKSFAKVVAEEDENVRSIRIEPELTKVDYAVPARFFWIIPAKITASISVDNVGNVKVRLPWYNIFAKTTTKLNAWDIGHTLDEQAAASGTYNEFSRQAWTLRALAGTLKNFSENK